MYFKKITPSVKTSKRSKILQRKTRKRIVNFYLNFFLRCNNCLEIVGQNFDRYCSRSNIPITLNTIKEQAPGTAFQFFLSYSFNASIKSPSLYTEHICVEKYIFFPYLLNPVSLKNKHINRPKTLNTNCRPMTLNTNFFKEIDG